MITEQPITTPTRSIQAAHLRIRCHKYREIAEIMGVSCANARQLAIKGLHELKFQETWMGKLGFNGRMCNCMANAGIHTKEDLVRAIKSGSFHYGRPGNTRNLGRKTYLQICLLLQLKLP